MQHCALSGPPVHSVPTEEPRSIAFQGICEFYALLREMSYFQYIELKEKTSRDLEFILL